MHYICSHCITEENVLGRNALPRLIGIACKNQKPNCRAEMEEVGEEAMEESKNMVSYLNSATLPYEDVKGGISSTRNRTFKMRMPNGLVILPQNKAFTRLRTLSFRDYYMRYRFRINFIRMNQAILFEHISTNLSNLFKFPNAGIDDFNPTAHTKPHLVPFHTTSAFMRKLTQISYGSTTSMSQVNWDSLDVATAYFVTGETYFNFLTCQGRYKSAPLTFYSYPFRFSTWISVWVAGFMIISVLLSTTRAFSIVHPDGLSRRLILSTIESLTCYSISIVLENNVGSALPGKCISSCVPQAVLCILSIISITLGCLYKSVITTHIILPLPVSVPYESLDQLDNFTLLTRPAADLLLPDQGTGLSRVPDRVGLNLSYQPGPGAFMHQASELVNFLTLRVNTDMMQRGNARSASRLYMDILNRIRFFESEDDILDQLSACEAKAFVGSAEEVEEYLKFSQTKVVLGMGSKPFAPHAYYWQIPNCAGEYVQRRMGILLSSGIYKAWERAFYAKTRDGLESSLKRTTETTQSLDTNLGTLFKLTVIGLASAFVVFFIELQLAPK